MAKTYSLHHPKATSSTLPGWVASLTAITRTNSKTQSRTKGVVFRFQPTIFSLRTEYAPSTAHRIYTPVLNALHSQHIALTRPLDNTSANKDQQPASASPRHCSHRSHPRLRHLSRQAQPQRRRRDRPPPPPPGTRSTPTGPTGDRSGPGRAGPDHIYKYTAHTFTASSHSARIKTPHRGPAVASAARRALSGCHTELGRVKHRCSKGLGGPRSRASPRIISPERDYRPTERVTLWATSPALYGRETRPHSGSSDQGHAEQGRQLLMYGPERQ